MKLEDIPLDHRQIPAPVVKSRKIHVQFLGSPVNPSDLNQLEGVYPLKPIVLPAVGGNEGVAKVLNVVEGDEARPSLFKAGDLVIPAQACFGKYFGI